MTSTSAASPASSTGTSAAPGRLTRVQHLVLNVRDLEASHRFYTEVIGFEMCAELERENVHMRFYRGNLDHHHDLALSQVMSVEDDAPPYELDMLAHRPGVGHVALEYTKEEWERQVEHLKAIGADIFFEAEHGMATSVYVADPDGNGVEILYDLPKERWENNLASALTYYKSADGAEHF